MSKDTTKIDLSRIRRLLYPALLGLLALAVSLLMASTIRYLRETVDTVLSSPSMNGAAQGIDLDIAAYDKVVEKLGIVVEPAPVPAPTPEPVPPAPATTE